MNLRQRLARRMRFLADRLDGKAVRSAAEIAVRVHSIAEDGLPDMDRLTGEVAFIFDGCIVSGWPLHVDPTNHDTPYSGYWEADSDVGRNVKFANVTHWVEFPEPVWCIGKAVTT